MKLGKSAVALLLVCTMMLSMVPVAGAMERFEESRVWADNLFTDVPKDQWYYETVKEAYELSLMNGDIGGIFRPDGLVTLAETVTVAARIHAIAKTGKEDFVQGTPWYGVYVEYALKEGILPAELPNYNRAATREEFAEILSKALTAADLKAINTVEDGAIPDVKDNDAVYLLYRAGVLTGNDSKGTFAPKSNIKRSEVAAIVARMAVPELRKSLTLTAGQLSSALSGGGSVELLPDSGEINPEDYIDKTTNALTLPFDMVYPDVFESGAVAYSGEQIMIKLATDSGLSSALQAAGVTAMEKLMEISSGVWYKAYISGEVKDVMAAVREVKEVLVAEYDFAYETEAITDCTAADVDSDVHGNKDYADQWYLCSCGIQKGWGHLKHHHHHGPKPDDKDQGDENVGIAGDGVVVAVIDTGVDYDHKDLLDNIWYNDKEIPNNNIDDDQNGYVDDYYGVNVITGKGNGDDDNGHGTHVAGIIASVDNEVGTVGIAYNAKIMPIKAGMASGYFNQSDIAKAITYACQQGADVINMSFGGSASSIAVTEALEFAYTYCVLVASAGNDGYPNEYVPGWTVLPNYPAALSYVLGVMSVDENGKESMFTNWDVDPFNSVEYELYAPGEAMLSTIPGDRYATWSGTSMAAPVVSGMAALLRAEFYDRNTYPTKFIYGQLSGTGTQTATCLDPKAHGKHNLPKIVDLYQAMTVLPKPEVGVSDYVIFDTPGLKGNEKNNGDGVIDASETIAIGFTLRNRWGKTGETVVSVDTLSQAGISDPYVTILNNDVNYGSVGTYSTQNAGWIKDADGVYIGWEKPIYLQISPDCPNDYIVKLNVHTASTNGLDAADTATYSSIPISYNLNIRRGVTLPNIISEDMTLTKNDYWIIPNAMIIDPGVTVTVEPGTQIQFWSDDPNDAYADSAITYLVVEGEFICNGTAEEPVRLYPSERMDAYRVEIREQNGGLVQLFHTEVVNPYLEITYAENCEFSQTYRAKPIYYRVLRSGVIYVNNGSGKLYSNKVKDCAFYKLGTYYDGFYTYGHYDGCIFVDSAIQTDRYSQFENCVFQGNNNYLDEQTGAVSAITLERTRNLVFDDASHPVTIVTNEETGVTYMAVYSNDAGYELVQTAQRFAETLGGTLACINTEEELQFLQKNLPSNHYVLGVKRDDKTDAPVWMDGTALGAFVPFEERVGWKWARFYLFYDSISNDAYTQNTGISGYVLFELPGEIYVQDIVLGQEHLYLDTNDPGLQIEAALDPTTAEDTLQYRSQDETIAKVSETGFVTPVGAGSTAIVITSSDSVVSVELPVTVRQHVAMTAVELGEDLELAKGETHTLLPALTPEDTTELLIYSSDDDTVAAVGADGVIHALKPGTATITAACEDNAAITDSITVTVVVPLQTITAEEPLYVTNAETAETVDVLGVQLSPADTTQTTLIWESSNPEIVDVDADGNLIKNPEGGSATLRATVKGTDLYTEVTVILSAQDNDVTVVQMQRLGSMYTFALLSDGTLWYWGGTVLVPTKLPFENVAQFAVGERDSYYQLLLVDTEGTLNVYQKYYNTAPAFTTSHLDNTPIYGEPVTGVVDVASYSGNSNGFFLYVDSDGAVWGWGYNGRGQLGINNKEEQYKAMQMQLPAGVRIVDAETNYSYDYSVLLASNGDLYYSGYSDSSRNVLTPTLYASGVQAITPIDNAVQIETADTVQYGLWNNTYDKQGDRMYCNGNSRWYLEDGVVYGRGSNGSGQLGLGDTNHRDDYEPMEKITGAKELFVINNTVYIQTDDGRFYGVGANGSHQIPNLSQGNQLVPSRIYFGLEAQSAVPVLEGTNLTADTLTEDRLMLDFDQGLTPGSGIASVTLQDSAGKRLSLVYEQRLDKFYAAPYSGFTAGETYTLTIPANALVNHFNVSVDAMTLTFTAAAAETEELLLLSEEETEEVEVRFAWTAEKFQERWEEYLLSGPNPRFYNNAVLNRLNREDKVETEWLRVQAAETTNRYTVSVTGNYWGTDSEFLINKQIVDFDDYQQYANLNHEGYLTEAPENVWPFVVKAGLLNADGEEVELVGNEQLTFFVEFNRDMNQTIPLDVRFGSSYPYADYAVEGKWVSARRWEGTTTLTTLIEGGYQFWSIANGCAADAPLQLYKDWGRFPFRIDTTAAQAMILQASATDTGIQLEWMQDDFATLAGYNLYRAKGSENALYTRINATVIPADVKTFFDDNVEPGEIYYYNFTVVKTDLSESAPSGRTMVMSKDTIPPKLIFTPVGYGTVGRNLAISATVTDNLSLRSVKLYYRTAGTEDWTSVEMTHLNDKYSAIVAGNTLSPTGLEYYIEAFDGVGYAYKGSAEAPYTAVIREESGNNELGDFDADGAITIVDAYMILRAANGQINVTDEAQLKRADINGNGEINASDALTVLKYVNGEIGSLQQAKE